MSSVDMFKSPTMDIYLPIRAPTIRIHLVYILPTFGDARPGRRVKGGREQAARNLVIVSGLGLNVVQRRYDPHVLRDA